jgi:oligoendopeptidase F
MVDLKKIKTNWNLDYFYKDLNDKNLNNDINSIMPLVLSFKKKYENKIKHFKPNDFLIFFKEKNKISYIINKISFYLNYRLALETQNQDLIKKNAEFEVLLTNISNELLFISDEFKTIGYNKLIKLSNQPQLKEYQNYFYQTAKSIKYLLNKKCEFVLNHKENSGVNAFINLYNELVNSFVFEIVIDGKKKFLTESEVRTLKLSSNEKIRQKAQESLRKVYNDKKVIITLANTYNAIVKDHISEIKIRKYKHVLSQRNISEELDDIAVNMLFEEVKNSYYLYQRYLRLKAKLLNKKKLMNYDLYAPIQLKEKKIQLNEALNIYFEAIREFDLDFYNYSIDMFKKGRVDIFPNKGKMSGAFASFTSDFDSFVLLNYTQKLDDVLTIAHEMGHAIHGNFRQHLKPENFQAPLILEETASIFNEMIVFENLLEKSKNTEKIILIEKKLQDIFATIFTQIQYTLFEKEIHEFVLNEKELSREDFNNIWRKKQLELTGNELNYDVLANEETTWAMIPHIFKTPFYCYSYAFGNLISFALFKKYKNNKKDFIKIYKNILKSGGSKKPYDLLLENNINIKSTQFFKDGIKIIEELVNEFEKLIK